MKLPRCTHTDIPRLWCACTHCAQGFTMTLEEQRQRELWLDRAGEPPSLPAPPRDRRVGTPIPEYRTRPLGQSAITPIVTSGATCQSPHCDRYAGTAYLCPACTDDLERILADIPHLVADLEIHAWGQVVMPSSGEEGEGTGISAASTLIHHIHGDLVTAVRILTERRGIIPDLSDNTATLAAWLLRNAAAIPLDPAGPDILTGLQRWHARTLRAIDRPEDRIYIGLCDQCATPLRAIEGRAEYACPTCRRNHDVQAKLDSIAQRLRDQLATVAELQVIAHRCGHKVTEHAIRGLIRRGRLQRVGKGDPARYRAQDLLAVLDERASA